MADNPRERITRLLTRGIDPADSHQLGGQTFKPMSEAEAPMALQAPFRMPASLMGAQPVAQVPYQQGQDQLNIVPPSQRRAEDSIYATGQRMLRGR